MLLSHDIIAGRDGPESWSRHQCSGSGHVFTGWVRAVRSQCKYFLAGRSEPRITRDKAARKLTACGKHREGLRVLFRSGKGESKRGPTTGTSERIQKRCEINPLDFYLFLLGFSL